MNDTTGMLSNHLLNDTGLIAAKQSVYMVAVPCLLAMCVLNILANCYVLSAAYYLKPPLNTVIQLTLSLAAADVWVSCLFGVGLLVNSFLPLLSSFAPRYHGWQNRSCFVLVIEALSSKCLTRLSIKLLIFLTWILPSTSHVILFLVLSGNGSQLFGCKTSVWINSMTFRTVMLLLIILPLLVMVYLYSRIVYIIVSGYCQVSACQKRWSLRRLRAVKTALQILMTFLVCWAPTAVFYNLTCPDCAYPFKRLEENHFLVLMILGIGTNALMILKSMINPLIYGSRIPEIKAAIRRMNDRRTSSGIPVSTTTR